MHVGHASLTCEACSGPARVLRHSSAWDFDVARCRRCGTAFVPDADRVLTGRAEAAADGDIDWAGYVEVMRDDDDVRRRVLDGLKRRLPEGRRELFDVGAGSGDFLVLARQEGFAVRGNELSPAAITFAAENLGIELSPDLLDAQPPSSTDAIVMWCVVAHVGDARTFLSEAFAMLRPGGVLFLRTPRWCAIDTAGVVMARGARQRQGRATAVTDRRVSPAHLRLYSEQGIRSLLGSIGFEDVTARPTANYSLKSDFILQSVPGPKRAVALAAQGLDAMIGRDLVPRNALMVYARKPA